MVALRLATSQQKIDLAEDYVAVGPYIIQNRLVYGLTVGNMTERPDYDVEEKTIITALKSVSGVVFTDTKSGTQTGYGHGLRTFRLSNLDGSLIYEISWINHCDGPGFSCSYSHGPWEKYGEYRGDAHADPELVCAVEALKVLNKKFNW